MRLAEQGEASSGSVVVAAEPGTGANPLLSLGQVATRLDVSVKTVRRLLKRGHFPGALRIDTGLRVPEADVVAYIRRQRVVSRPVPS